MAASDQNTTSRTMIRLSRDSGVVTSDGAHIQLADYTDSLPRWREGFDFWLSWRRIFSITKQMWNKNQTSFCLYTCQWVISPMILSFSWGGGRGWRAVSFWVAWPQGGAAATYIWGNYKLLEPQCPAWIQRPFPKQKVSLREARYNKSDWSFPLEETGSSWVTLWPTTLKDTCWVKCMS